MNRTVHQNVDTEHGALGNTRRGKKKTDRLRQAMARRRLEEYREQKDLQEHLYDVFVDGL